jgi:hypothetical protein
MIKLSKNILIVCLLMLLTYLLIWLIPPKSDFVYASIIDKHQRLMATESPKIVFIGGSGVALGLNSQFVQKNLHMPIVNMGVNAELGLNYMLEEVKPDLKSGDIIIIVPEYEHFYGSVMYGGQNLLWVLRVFPNAAKYIPLKQYLNLLPEFPIFIQARFLEILSAKSDPVYNRNAFNEYGDFINHLSKAPEKITLYPIAAKKGFNEEAIQALNDFNTYATYCGAKVFFLFPAISADFLQYEDNQEKIQLVYTKLKDETQITLLSSPTEYIFPTKYFFDTVYHLNAEGRQIRSEKIVADLRDVNIETGIVRQ